MEREIKFKAWDKENKVMSKSFSLLEWIKMIGSSRFHIGRATGLLDDKTQTPELYEEKRLFLQFTGLKDKAGNEIFEGDVANSIYGKGEVYWNSGTGKFDFEFDTDSDCLWQMCSGSNKDSFEVIGNVYQNENLRLPNRIYN